MLRGNEENKILVILTGIYILTWYLQLGSRIDILGTIRFEFILGAFLSIVAILKISSQSDKPSPLRNPVILYLAILAFYTIFSYDRSTSIDVFIDRIIKFSMMGLFLAAFIKSPWALKFIIACFLIAMFKLGQEGFSGWLGGGLVWQNQGVMRLHGSTLLYRHPNSFSGMAVGCLPFIYFLYPVVNKRWHKIFLLILLTFCGIIIAFTASRTGYVATLLLLIYATLKLKGSQKKYIIIITLVSIPIAATLLPHQYVDRFVSIFTMEETEGSSASSRIQILKDATIIAIEKPWGVGVSAFPKVRTEIFGRTQDTHNLYLELLTNLSVIGLFIFIWLISKIIGLNLSIQKEIKDIESGDARFLSALSKSIVGFVIARLFLGLFGMDTYEIYWWFAIGLTISVYRTKLFILESCALNDQEHKAGMKITHSFMRKSHLNATDRS